MKTFHPSLAANAVERVRKDATANVHARGARTLALVSMVALVRMKVMVEKADTVAIWVCLSRRIPWMERVQSLSPTVILPAITTTKP